MALSDFSIVTRSLRARLFSTVTTTITVAVAVALLLVLVMMRAAAADAFARGTGNMHLLVSADVSPLASVLNGVFYASPPKRALPYSKVRQLAADLPLGDNGYAIPNHQGDSFRGLPVLDTLPEFFTRFEPAPATPWRFSAGRAFDKPFEVVLGADAARLTGLALGSHLHLSHGMSSSAQGQIEHDEHEHSEFEFTVVGILAPTGSPHDRALFTHLTSTWILHAHDRREKDDPNIHETTEANLTDEDRQVTGLYVRLATRPGSDVSASLQAVFDQLRRDGTLTIAAPADEMKKLMRLVANVDQILLAMAIVVMISSGIAIMLALYNSMEHRRRQIAILRVLGASRPRIFALVVTESTILGLMGGVLGLLASLFGAKIVSGLMHQRLGLLIPPSLPPRETVAILLGCVALAALAGIVPATMAYRTSVAKNLRPLG